MPNVLLLCEFSALNGAEQSMLATLDGLRDAGFVPAVMAPPAGPLAEALRDRDVELIALRTRDAAGNRLPQGRLREQLAEVLRKLRPDVLHANSLSMGRLSGPVAVGLKVPSIAHLRDIVRLSAQAVADLNCHARLLAVSEATRRFHVASGLAAERTHVLYNGVDVARFCPRPGTGYLHRQLGLPPESQLIGTIGQISLRKGQDVLLSAAALLAERLPEACYVLVGERFSDKEESRRYEAQLRAAAETALPGRCFFLGYRDDVPALLNELTLLVHPARQEPLGRVLLEAAAAGVAVIATDVGGTREIFAPESEAARLIPFDEPVALGAAIEELMGDEALRARLGAAGRRRAEEAFDVRRAVAGLAEHYRAIA